MLSLAYFPSLGYPSTFTHTHFLSLSCLSYLHTPLSTLPPLITYADTPPFPCRFRPLPPTHTSLYFRFLLIVPTHTFNLPPRISPSLTLPFSLPFSFSHPLFIHSPAGLSRPFRILAPNPPASPFGVWADKRKMQGEASSNCSGERRSKHFVYDGSIALFRCHMFYLRDGSIPFTHVSTSLESPRISVFIILPFQCSFSAQCNTMAGKINRRRDIETEM